MGEMIVESKACTKADVWRKRITEQERSGLAVSEFCKERGFTAWSFYNWRKRLRETGPVRFALVDRAERQDGSESAGIEVVFATGERVLIRSGVDDAILRRVFQALRG